MKPEAAAPPTESGDIQVRIAYNSRKDWAHPEVANWQTVHYNAERDSLDERCSITGRPWAGEVSVVVAWLPLETQK